MKFSTEQLKKYPSKPGVYIMKDLNNTVLYIGKAKNLKSRLKQYFFSKADQREMIPFLLTQVSHIDTIIVLSEKDALLLENNLIKRHQPKYNILLKDDKMFLSILLTKHKWPTLKIVRSKSKNKQEGTYFGPYTNAKAARQTLDLILRLFPLRQCSDAELKSRTRPCLLYDIKRCIAPCVNKCSESEYQLHVKSAKRLLLGKDKTVIKELKEKMQKASNEMEFELAQDYLQMIRQIQHVLSVQHVDNPNAINCDVLGLYHIRDAALIALLSFREGKLISSEHFSFHQIAGNDEEILTSFLIQHYKKQTCPSLIYLPIDLSKKPLEEILSEKAQKKIKISTPQKGDKLKLVQMAQKNAASLFERQEDQRSLKEKMLLDLQQILKLNRFPRKIECFDTSNISGQDAVAAKVCFINGEKDKSKIKLFKIKKTKKSNDYEALEEVLLRHFAKEKEFCDLLIVDGGKGQLNIALSVLKKLNIASIDTIGVAKQSALHTKGLTEEKIYLPYQKDPLNLSPRSPMLFLLQKIRDEAHRVCISFHRKRRSKRTIVSQLDEIEGIGPTKRKRLLQHFGSVKKIKKASRDELGKVPGLTKKDIDRLLKL